MQPWILIRNADPLRRVGGRTLLQRICLQLRLRGIEQVLLLCAADLGDRALANVEATGIACHVHCLDTPLPARHTRAPVSVVIEAGRLYDPRLLQLVTNADRPVALVDRSNDQPPAAAQFVGLAVIGIESAGSAPAREVVDAGVREALRDRPIGVEAVPRYVPELRRFLRPYWCTVAGPADRRQARWLLARAASKGHMEWLVLLLNRPVETLLCRLLAETPIRPNQLTLIGIAVALGATALFATGWLGAGVAVALGAQILDGLDGRQARIQLRFSPWGKWEHVLDKLVEISWVGGLATHFQRAGTVAAALAWGVAWILALNAANAAGSHFRARTGRLPEETSRIDAAIRLLGARRNTNTALFGIGVAAGMPAAAYVAVAALQVVTAVLLWVRVPFGLRRYRASRASRSSNSGERTIRSTTSA